jgi:Domain of unknown function DUF11
MTSSRLRIVSAALAAGIVSALLTAGAGADCSTSGCRADVGIFGSSYPANIHPRQTSLLYFTAKDNGPGPAYGIQLQVRVPYQLKIVYARGYSGASCSIKGTFVQCDEGNFRREQLAVVVIKVKSRGKKGTYEIPSKVYSQGVDDPNVGNNQVTETVAVY